MAHNAAQDARLTDSRVATYAAEQDAMHQRRFAILEAFGYALEHPEELSLAYQPRIDLGSGQCRGVEAVLRWQSARLGPVSPAEFVPFVEQSAMIRGATALVLQMGLRQLAEWRAAGLALELAVNVSAMNLLEHDFAQRLAAGLAESGLDPSFLEIEMTESAFIGETNLMLSMLRAVAALGVRLAIDDFGTGYSGLSYLQRLPAQIVKIDQSFIRNLATEAGNRAVVRATVSPLPRPRLPRGRRGGGDEGGAGPRGGGRLRRSPGFSIRQASAGGGLPLLVQQPHAGGARCVAHMGDGRRPHREPFGSGFGDGGLERDDRRWNHTQV